MELSKRQISIFNRILRSDSFVTIKDLASEESVTPQTVYNDLKLIESLRISVSRGSVEIKGPNGKESLAERKINYNRAIRENACFYAIDSIMGEKPKGTIFIDGGSTGFIFFDCLRTRDIHDLTILTNNPLILGSITKDPNFFINNSIYSVGGRLDPVRLSLYSISRNNGFLPTDDEYFIDFFILGFRTIAPNGSVYISNEEEIEQKKYLISKSKNLILIATPDKLNAAGLFKIDSLKKKLKERNGSIKVIFADNDTKFKNSEGVKELSSMVGNSNLLFI